MSGAPKFVYFIRPVGMDGPVKIGCSSKPASRLLTLSAWSPFPLELIGSVPGTFADEGRLHRRFSDLHTRKEWFRSSPLLRSTIEQILAGASIKDVCRAIAPKKPIRNQMRPIKTDDRRLFLKYGSRIRSATRGLWKSGGAGNYFAPEDVRSIMHAWRCDRVNNHLPVSPTPDQIARLEEFLADPQAFAVLRLWRTPAPNENQKVAA